MPVKTQRYTPHNLRWFNKLLKWTFGAWLIHTYRIESRGAEVVKRLKPPYVLVANHVSTRDPFFLSAFMPEPVYWVTSDGNMRTRLMRWLLGLVGSIPKTKVIPDIETINWIVEVTRKRKGVVGIFPEGQASWDGRTLPLFPSTGKLVKLLKVPVLAARIRGGYSSLPRWTWKRRHGKVIIEWRVILSPEELKALSADEALARLEEALAHDETAFLEESGIAYRSSRRAEHLELCLFTCPRCGTRGSLKSRRNRIHCAACGTTLALDEHYRFHALGAGETCVFDTIPAWDAWQLAAFKAAAEEATHGEPSKALLADAGAVLLKGHKMNPLRRLRVGTLLLYPDRIELACLSGMRLRFPISEIEGAGVLKRNLLEFYRGTALYQVRFPLRSISARKWLVGIETFSALARRRAEA